MSGKPEDRMPDAVREAASDDGPMPDADALFGQLEARISERPRRARMTELSTPRRVGLGLGIGLLTALAAMKGPLPVAGNLAGNLGLVSCLVYFAAAAWLVLAALRPLHRPTLLPGGLALRAGLGSAVVIGLAVVPSMLSQVNPVPIAKAFACLGMGTAYALPTFAMLRLLDRGQRLGPWLAALAAGVMGNLALQLHCPADDPTHRLLGHALVLGSVALLAAAIGLGTGQRRRGHGHGN